MKKHIIPPYPTLDGVQELCAKYSFKSEDIPLSSTELPDGTLTLKKEGGMPWTAQDDPLAVSLTVNPQPLNKLKAKTGEIIPDGAVAAVVLTWHSKGTMQRGVSSACKLEMSSKEQVAKLKIKFGKAALRDTLSFQTVVILAEASKNGDGRTCNIPGSILGYVGDTFTVRADGRGSVFPAFGVFGDRKDSLWSLWCSWDDCMTEKFDADSVRVDINLNHPDCPEEWKTKGATDITPLSKSVIRDAIGTLILSVMKEDEVWEAIKRTPSFADADFERGSIAHAVWHLYTSYNLNDESPASLMMTAGKIKL